MFTFDLEVVKSFYNHEDDWWGNATSDLGLIPRSLEMIIHLCLH
jgi:hypothetical protein